MKLRKRKYILVKASYRYPTSWETVGTPTTDQEGLIQRARYLMNLQSEYMYKVREAK